MAGRGRVRLALKPKIGLALKIGSAPIGKSWMMAADSEETREPWRALS